MGHDSRVDTHLKHVEQVKGVLPEDADFRDTQARDEMLAWLQQGGKQIFYLFCHGEAPNGFFALRFGTEFLAAADLEEEPPWPRDALVVLNGCTTMALTPTRTHKLVEKLRALGARAVVGTEVEVVDLAAQPFGARLLDRLLGGATLGEAFRELRCDLLRDLNPTGLAYTFSAPAALHVHGRERCLRCEAGAEGRAPVLTRAPLFEALE
jgi:hypothetical protein